MCRSVFEMEISVSYVFPNVSVFCDEIRKVWVNSLAYNSADCRVTLPIATWPEYGDWFELALVRASSRPS